MESSKNEPERHGKVIGKAFKRMLILFGLGLFLSLYPRIFYEPLEAFNTVRIPGVLQRISIVFFAAAVIYLKFSRKAIFRTMLGLLLLYWVLMVLVPVPGVGYANLEKETNLGAWLDRTILTEAHLWKSVRTWDPEGILSTLPAIATGLFGVLAGMLLKRKDKTPAEKVSWLFTAGVLATLLGLAWDLGFPINKSLWTSSFVLYTGGLASIGLALCYWVIDIQQYNRFTTPAVVYGVNAITVFFISGLLPRTLNLIKVTNAEGAQTGLANHFYQTAFVPYFSPINASLAMAVFWVLFWMVILWVMYRKKVFIKV
ncbi:MAG: DUF5009 domain-containing protein [Sphingobacteriales bacterium]|nr:MAG: DUF5009 domain-containing protein [Sphingobacteriales bacterium]